MPQEYIYVLAFDGRPLMPTQRRGHVFKLLRRGKARIAEHVPEGAERKRAAPEFLPPPKQSFEAGKSFLHAC